VKSADYFCSNFTHIQKDRTNDRQTALIALKLPLGGGNYIRYTTQLNSSCHTYCRTRVSIFTQTVIYYI